MRSGGPRLQVGAVVEVGTRPVRCLNIMFVYCMTSKLPLTAALGSAVGMAPIVSLHDNVIVIQRRYDGLKWRPATGVAVLSIEPSTFTRTILV